MSVSGNGMRVGMVAGWGLETTAFLGTGKTALILLRLAFPHGVFLV